MKHLNGLFICLLSVVFATSYGQSIQPGFVKEYNERTQKTPLSDVEIVISNASSTASGVKGDFILHFRTLKPGDKVNVRRIEKLGYEIFNKEALEQWFISRDNSPFTIVMCRSDKFKRIRDTYSRVSSESYEKQLKKEEARLRAERKAGKLKEAEYEAALKKLNDEYDQQLENLDNYVDRFARIDLSELSAVEAEIIELVQKGNIEDAIRRYEQQNLEEKYKEQVAVGRKAQAGIDALTTVKAESQMSCDSLFSSILRKNEMLKLAGGRENFEKIGKSLKETALNDTSYFAAVWEYAEFAYSQNIFEDAAHFYDICSRLSTDRIEKLKISQRKGALLLKQNRFRESEYSFMAALKISMQLWEIDSTNYRSYVADVQNDIAHLYAKMRNFRKAENFFQQAQYNYKVLCDNQENFLESMTNLQIHLGEMYMDMRQFHCVDTLLNQAMKNASSLFNTLPDKYRPLMAAAENSLGRIHRYYMRYEEAKTAMNKSLEYGIILYGKNPRAYRPMLAGVYSRLSDLYTLMRDFQGAKNAAEKAIALYDTLIATSTEAYLPDIANIRNEQANLCQMARRYTDLKRYVSEGYELTKQLYVLYPDVYRFDLFNLTMNMGISSAMHNQLREAEAFFLAGKKLVDTLRREYPQAYLPTYLNFVKNMGSLYNMMHQYDKDSLYTAEAMLICNQLYESNPYVYKRELSSMLYNYAVYYNKTGKYIQADSMARYAETLTSQLVDKYPDIFMEDYRRLIKIIGTIQGNLNNKEVELKYKHMALDKARALFDKNPDVYMYDYVESLEDVAFYYLENDDKEKAGCYFDEGTAKIRQLYNQYPAVYAPKMGKWLMIVTLYYRTIKEYENAMSTQEESTRIYENLYKELPDRYSFELGLCFSQKAAMAYFNFNDESKAEQYYLKALPLLYTVLSSNKAARGQILTDRRTLVDIYRHSGKFDMALEQVDAILELNPNDEEVIEQKKELKKMNNNVKQE